MLYIFCTGPYYTVCLHFTLAPTGAYAFHFNVMYICLYVHVFLFKNVRDMLD